VIGYLLGTEAPYHGHYAGENWMVNFCLSVPVIPMLGTGIGIGVGWLAQKGLGRVFGDKAAIGLATVCAAIIATISGYAIVAISLRAIHFGLIP
jgi:hypothetical protein